MSERVHIVGIGDDGLEGLSSSARQLLDQADLIVGAPQAVSAAPAGAATRSCEQLDELIEVLEQNADRHLVVLTIGDPLFYGVTRYLWDRLGKERFEVLPHVSTMQLAFARVKESWDDAYLVNLATQPLERVLDKVRLAEKVGLFTTEQIAPGAVAQALLDQGVDCFTAYVCENLGSPDERVTHGELAEIAQQRFSPLNVMILVRKPAVPDRPIESAGRRLFGNPDDYFLQSAPKRGLLTPMEVRVIALAELDLGPASVVWDVGAGSGAVAIEAAQIAHEGTVFAIEMDPEDQALLIENVRRFQVQDTVQPVLGRAPDAWEPLPDPDAIFVGGTGRAVGEITRSALQRLKPGGRLVANVGSLDNVLAVQQAMANQAGQFHVRLIQLAHDNPQLDRIRFESLNPTFLLSFVKDGS